LLYEGRAELLLQIQFGADGITRGGMSLAQIHLRAGSVGSSHTTHQQASRSSRPNLPHKFRPVAGQQ
jgi:hypothetical protein